MVVTQKNPCSHHYNTTCTTLCSVFRTAHLWGQLVALCFAFQCFWAGIWRLVLTLEKTATNKTLYNSMSSWGLKHNGRTPRPTHAIIWEEPQNTSWLETQGLTGNQKTKPGKAARKCVTHKQSPRKNMEDGLERRPNSNHLLSTCHLITKKADTTDWPQRTVYHTAPYTS